jgi:hypothetical protein
MPIIQPVNDPSTPLSQGDILKGVCLFSTKKSWAPNGGEPAPTPNTLSLVLSRPCVAAHGASIVVALIEQYKNKAPVEFSSYEAALDFFTAIRDGQTTPDLFYLGQIPNIPGVYCARFDSVHTIQVPKEGTSERQAFLAASRIGRLDEAFAHDLHVRHFRAFASLGFDDHGWFSTDDLRVLVAVADKDEKKLQADLAAITARLELGQSQGFHHESEKKKHEKDAAAVIAKIAELSEKIAPYRVELAKRTAVAVKTS